MRCANTTASKLRNAFHPQILMIPLVAGARSGPFRQQPVSRFSHLGLTFGTRSHPVSEC